MLQPASPCLPAAPTDMCCINDAILTPTLSIKLTLRVLLGQYHQPWFLEESRPVILFHDSTHLRQMSARDRSTRIIEFYHQWSDGFFEAYKLNSLSLRFQTRADLQSYVDVELISVLLYVLSIQGRTHVLELRRNRPEQAASPGLQVMLQDFGHRGSAKTFGIQYRLEARPITAPPHQHREDPGFCAVANTQQCTPDTTTSLPNNPPLPLSSAVSSAETRSADMLARSGVRTARAFGSARTQATKNATVRKIYPNIRPSSPDTCNQWQ